MASTPVFRSLVCAAALREILTRILRVEGHTDPDAEDQNDWRSRWLRFAVAFPGVGDPPPQDEEDEFDDWIESAVAAFARQFRLRDQFASFLQSEESR